MELGQNFNIFESTFWVLCVRHPPFFELRRLEPSSIGIVPHFFLARLCQSKG